MSTQNQERVLFAEEYEYNSTKSDAVDDSLFIFCDHSELSLLIDSNEMLNAFHFNCEITN